MDRLRKLLKGFSLKSDIINMLVGIVLIVSLVFVFQNPNNQFAILIACTAGGLMNIMNGLKMIKDPKKKTTGMTFLMMGVILIFLGFAITQILKGV